MGACFSKSEDVDQPKKGDNDSIAKFWNEKFATTLNESGIDGLKKLVKGLSSDVINVTNSYGDSLLHLATRTLPSEKCLEVIKCLIDHGFNHIQTKNSQGLTFLHLFLNHSRPSLHEFNELAFFLVKKRHASLFNVKAGLLENTLFQDAVARLGIDEAVLIVLHSGGVDLHAVNKSGRNCMWQAVEAGSSVNILSRLMEFGVDASIVDNDGWNLLHLAAHYGKEPTTLIETTKFFQVTRVVDFNAVTNEGLSALLIAVQTKKSVDYLKMLVQLGADWKIVTKNKGTVLTMAARHHTAEAVKYFLGLGGVDVNQVDNTGRSVLHLVVYSLYGNLEECFEAVKCLVDHGCNVYTKNAEGLTFMRLLLSMTQISSEQFTKFAIYLVEKGHADLFNVKSGHDESTLLQDALGSIEIEEQTLSLLVSIGAAVNEVDRKGWNCLAAAIRGGRTLSLLSQLVELGADVNLVARNNWTLLHLVASEGAEGTLIEVTHFLLDQGLNLHSLTSEGYSPLLIAIREKRSVNYLRFLIQMGVFWRLEIMNNPTALSFAAQFGTLGALMYFAELGEIDVNAVDSVDGNSALHYAVKDPTAESIVEKVRFLLSRGADPNARNRSGETPFLLAEKSFHLLSTMDLLKKLLIGSEN